MRALCIGDEYLTDSSSRFRQTTFKQRPVTLRKFDNIDGLFFRGTMQTMSVRTLSNVNGCAEVARVLIELSDTPPRTLALAWFPRGSIFDAVAGLAVCDHHVNNTIMLGNSSHKVSDPLFITRKSKPCNRRPTIQPCISPWPTGLECQLASP